MSYSDVKSSTSASVGSDEDGALFDETISAFKKRRYHAESLMVEAIRYTFPGSFRPYFNKPQWLTVDDDTENGKLGYSVLGFKDYETYNNEVNRLSLLSVTAELDQPLQVCLFSSQMGTIMITDLT